MPRRSIAVLMVFVAFGSFVPLACAQQNEQLPVPINVRVIDPAGAIIPGACVTIANSPENFNLSQETNSSGSLPVVLRPGNYEMTVQASGFVKRSAQLEVKRDSPPSIQIKLVVASCSQCVEVRAAQPGDVFCTPCRCHVFGQQ
jgi:uncharacterized membrane protein